MPEERKVVSILFVDLVDFTSRSDRADPEDVRDLLHKYHAAVKEQAERFGGTVEKFIGDAVMAVFGAPAAHTDDPERAVRAGLRALEAVKALDLAARASVNTGEAVVALGRGHEMGEALAMGDVVNTASRMQAAAPTGGLVVGETTYRATRSAIRYESRGELEAKGKRDPFKVWLAIEALSSPPPGRGGLSPLVGRQRQLTLLQSIWDAAAANHRPQLVTIAGPAGIGKSRLTREFGSMVAGAGGRAIRGRSLPYDTRDMYGAFAEQARSIAAIVDQDPPRAAHAKLEATVSRLVPDAERADVLRSLSLMLGLGIDAPIQEQAVLFFGARRFVEQLGLEAPTLLVFEDAHWADAAQVELVTYLAAHIRDTPAVLVVTARPEFLDARSAWGAGLPAHTMITLDPVSAGESVEMVRNLMDDEVPSEILDRIIEVAGGNPLFLEELAAGRREGGEVEDLPTTVRAAIAARVDALPPAQRDALLAASVIGKVFWIGAVRAVRDIDSLDEVLEALEARDFLRRESASRVVGDVEYRFKHILIRDVCYATLTRAERRTAHEAVARYIEAASGEKVRELAWLLAHHWEQAGDAARAIEYLMLAAERAEEALAVKEALELIARGESLTADDAGKRTIHLKLGLAMVRFELYDRAIPELEGILPKLEGRERVEAMLGLARAYHWTERTAETLAISEAAEHMAEEFGLREFVAPSMARHGEGYAMRGEVGDLDAAVELGERALETWTPGVLPEDLADHTLLMSHTHYWVGNNERALELSRAVRELAADPTSIEALLRGRGMEGLALANGGRYEEAIEIFERVIALGRDLGRPVRVLLNYSSMALRDLYDLDEARRRSEEALSQSERSSTFHMPYMNAVVDLIQTELLAGEVGAAEVLWKDHWDEVISTPAWERWFLGSKMAAFRGEMALQVGDFDEAVRWADRALEMTVVSRRPKYEVAARGIRGNALSGLRQRDAAARELEAAVNIADRLGSPTLRWRSRLDLARLQSITGDEAKANETSRDAASIIREIGSGLAPDRARRFAAAPQVAEALSFAADR